MKTILTVVGARPQFIKIAPVSRELRKSFREILIHTGQHFDQGMSDIFFQELEIPTPDYSLGISGGNHGEMTARMLEKIEAKILEIKPDLMLLYGDTNSTFAAAIAAAKLHIPIAHIESGPRTYDRLQPEEVNRVFTDYVSEIRFCPTYKSVENLKLENICDGVFHVGDVMYDCALYAREKAAKNSKILDDLQLTPKSYSVATVHRAEHTSNPETLKKVIDFLKAQDGLVVFPMHPRTSKAVEAYGISTDGLKVIPPLGYIDITWLVANSKQVITDSGGLPKEAYFHQVPCITIGEYSPWPETIEAGWNRLWTESEYSSPRKDVTDYGDGKAAQKIVEILKKYFAKAA